MPAVLAGAEHPSHPPGWGWDLALLSLQQLVSALAFSHSTVFPPGMKLPKFGDKPCAGGGRGAGVGALGSVAPAKGQLANAAASQQPWHSSAPVAAPGWG